MSKSNFRSLLNTTPVQSLPIDQCRHNINPFAIPDICSDTHLNPPTLKPKCLRTKSPPKLRGSSLTSQFCHSLNYSQLWALTSSSNTYLKLRFTLLTWTQCYQATKKGTFLQAPGQKKLLSSHCSFCLFCVFTTFTFNFFPSVKNYLPSAKDPVFLAGSPTPEVSNASGTQSALRSSARLASASSFVEGFCPQNDVSSFFSQFWVRHAHHPRTVPGKCRVLALYHLVRLDPCSPTCEGFYLLPVRDVKDCPHGLTPGSGAASGFSPRPSVPETWAPSWAGTTFHVPARPQYLVVILMWSLDG